MLKTAIFLSKKYLINLYNKIDDRKYIKNFNIKQAMPLTTNILTGWNKLIITNKNNEMHLTKTGQPGLEILISFTTKYSGK